MPPFFPDHPFTVFAAIALALVVSYAGSFLAMHSRALLDDPNHRSSHDHAVSRAGGLAMLAAAAAGLFVIAVFSRDAAFSEPAIKFLALGVAAGAVGLADDHLNLSAPIKFGGQFAVAILFIWQIGPLQNAALPFVGAVALGAAGAVLTAFWIVAFINAFNFMDGVNGIAGGAAALGLSIFALVAVQTGAGSAAAIALITTAAAAGFLPANLLRGKLFMGDCGSHFLAFMIAGLAVFAANESAGRASEWLLPTIFLPFILDVGFTLAHRVARRRNILTAHREHVYQLILRRGAGHASVAALYTGAIALCAAVAIFMLTLPPAMMWIAPAVFAVVLMVIGVRVFSAARANGLIENADAKAAS